MDFKFLANLIWMNQQHVWDMCGLYNLKNKDSNSATLCHLEVSSIFPPGKIKATPGRMRNLRDYLVWFLLQRRSSNLLCPLLAPFCREALQGAGLWEHQSPHPSLSPPGVHQACLSGPPLCRLALSCLKQQSDLNLSYLEREWPTTTGTFQTRPFHSLEKCKGKCISYPPPTTRSFFPDPTAWVTGANSWSGNYGINFGQPIKHSRS